MRLKNWDFSFLFSGTILINLWFTISLYPNPTETENSKPKYCIDKCNKEIKQCASITNAENEQTLCYESWRSCIKKPMGKEERKQKYKSCLNEYEAESLLCKTKATTYFIEYECKNRQTKCQKTCWKYGYQNRYKDHNDVDRRRNEELPVQDLWTFF